MADEKKEEQTENDPAELARKQTDKLNEITLRLRNQTTQLRNLSEVLRQQLQRTQTDQGEHSDEKQS
jgi:hypothetical protein